MLDHILGKEIAHYVRAHRTLLACSLALTVLSAIFVVVPAYLLQPFIDEGMKTGTDPASFKIPWVSIGFEGGFSWEKTELVLIRDISPNILLVVLALCAFLAMLVRSATLYLSQLAAAAFSNRSILSIRVDLFQKFIALPLAFYHRRKTGELVSRTAADLTVMQERIANILIGLVEYPLTALAFLSYVVLVNYKLTLLVCFATPLIVGFVRLFGRKVKKHSTRVQDAMAQVTAAYQETILCLKVVQGFCTNSTETEKFRGLARELYKSVMRWNRWSLGLGPLMDTTGFLIMPGILIIGKLYFHHTLGELVSLMYAYSRVYAPIKSLARVNNELRTLQGATERVFGIMGTVPEIRELPDAVNLKRHRESIEFDHVSFAYDPKFPVLRDLSFQIRAGEMVAFVGSTGAGKSTLLEILPRFYDVTGGRVKIDGTDIRLATLASLRSQISMVSQEVLLFHDTLANNVRYARPDAGMEEVIQAAKSAYAHDFILAQPQGYDSVVGDRGTLLSGGQRQRIAIARAILADPAILILDEAASALDAESEHYVQAAIERLRQGRTILVSAHRLSTVREANRIYVLERGEIIESGTQGELISQNGRFRQLYDMQFRA